MAKNDLYFILCIPIAGIIMLFQWLIGTDRDEEEEEPVTTVTKTVYIKRESTRRFASQVLNQANPTQEAQTTAPIQGAVNLW